MKNTLFNAFIESKKLENAINRMPLKIAFIDFWRDFDKNNNLFMDILKTKYDVIIDEDHPDIVFCSIFGSNFKKYTCKRILFIGENVTPNFNAYDYALAFDFMTFMDRYKRLPLYYYYMHNYYNDKNMLDTINSFDKDVLKRKFCSVLISNAMHTDNTRYEFFKLLNQYKKVDSGGRAFNNIGKTIENKIAFSMDYKFCFAFENTKYPGYTTEKIADAFLCKCVPIYYGSTLVGCDFNKKSFIDINDFKNFNEAIEFIKYIDNNDEKYLEMLNANPLNDGFCENLSHKSLLDFFVNIIENGKVYHKDSLRFRDENGMYKKMPLWIKYLSFFVFYKPLRKKFRQYLLDKVK